MIRRACRHARQEVREKRERTQCRFVPTGRRPHRYRRVHTADLLRTCHT